MSGALVVFSGGQDSATCLFWALRRYERVETIGFDYGQRHLVELQCRAEILRKLRERWPGLTLCRLGQDMLINMAGFGMMSESALTGKGKIETGADGLPTSFVPGRNLLFLTVAATRAYVAGLETIVTGVCETDYSGYPDCRRDTMDALQEAISLGMNRGIAIETPLMKLTKAQTWKLAEELGGRDLVSFIVAETHTCYEGERGDLHPWGYGCGHCPACELRRRGWEEYCRA